MNEVTRRDDGTFLPGQSGNPAGRPPGKKDMITTLKQDLEHAVRNNVKAEDIQAIMTKMVALAKEGNLKAAKLVLDKTVSNVTGADDVSGSGGGITIVVRNATVGANQNEPIDVTPIEESS